MQKAISLTNKGPLGIVLFWINLLLIALPSALSIFALVWLIRTSTSIWINSVGPSLLIANLFLFILCAVSIVCFILYWLTASSPIKMSLFYFLSVISLILCCIILKLSNSESASRYASDISDYVYRYRNETNVQEFVSTYSTTYSISSYVYSRTENYYSSMACFLGIWIVALILHAICAYQMKKLGLDKEDEAPLVNQQDPNAENKGYDQNNTFPEDNNPPLNQQDPQNQQNTISSDNNGKENTLLNQNVDDNQKVKTDHENPENPENQVNPEEEEIEYEEEETEEEEEEEEEEEKEKK